MLVIILSYMFNDVNFFSGKRCGPWVSCSFVCLFVVFHPTREFSLIWRRHHCHEGCKFRHVFSTYGHRVVEVLKRATPTVTRGFHLILVIMRTRDSYTCCRPLSSGAVTTCFQDLGLSRLGFEHLSLLVKLFC